MAYARIRMNFQVVDKAYRDFMSLPPDINKWLKDRNRLEDERKLPHSTSCCMQASLSFNAAGQPIPKSGVRNNETISGKYYILSVADFRAYLTYRYGPTDQVKDLASIKGKKGVLIFGNTHIEFWDGENIFQSLEGAKRRGANRVAVMSPGIMKSTPLWFWEIAEGASNASADVPAWTQGWWNVYDGNYYYYYFYPDGTVTFIETKPNPKWTPPKATGNHGKVQINEHGIKIVWSENGPPPATEETFTRLNWTSTTEMNGVSNKYSPLFARKM